MTVSRRSLIQGGAAGLGLFALGGLAACSTAAPGTSSAPAASGSAAGETTALILWTWPEGFGTKALDAVAGDLDFGPGNCGKGGQSVPAACGQPALRIRRITVGGTQRRSAERRG